MSRTNAQHDPASRCRLLLDTARFATLATCGPDGPWASTVNVVPLYQPLRLLWYSMVDARHSRNIHADPHTAVSVFRADLGDATPIGLDGLQLHGTAYAVTDDEVEARHRDYYRLNFPDPAIRAEWELLTQEFTSAGPRRFYILHAESMWLFDVDCWLVNKHDRRLEIPLSALTTPPLPSS